ncbi:hypothetical protein NRB_12600 [Novosphingobium sp. 11B]
MHGTSRKLSNGGQGMTARRCRGTKAINNPTSFRRFHGARILSRGSELFRGRESRRPSPLRRRPVPFNPMAAGGSYCTENREGFSRGYDRSAAIGTLAGRTA